MLSSASRHPFFPPQLLICYTNRYVDEKAASAGNFTFKCAVLRPAVPSFADTGPETRCHRKDTPGSKTQAVYAVNAISFHPFGTFSTAGEWQLVATELKTLLRSMF